MHTKDARYRLPPIARQIEEYRAAREKVTEDPDRLRPVTKRLAEQLGMPFEELRTRIRSGEIPAARTGKSGGLYLSGGTVRQLMDDRATATA